jgi:hypothetical protein
MFELSEREKILDMKSVKTWDLPVFKCEFSERAEGPI